MCKNFTFVILLLCITMFSSYTSFAQAKIAYVNMQQLVISMPEAKKAYDSLQRYQQSLVKDGQALVIAYQARAAEFDSLQEKYSPAIREVKFKVCAKKKDLFKGSKLHDDIVNLGMLEKSPYLATSLINMYAKCGALAKAKKVISDLATEKGYVCVLDNSKDIVITATCEDLFPAAKQKLGIK